MAHINYYFSTISPFAYLAGQRLEVIASKNGASITYKPLDIIGLFGRTGGTAVKDRHVSRLEYRAMDLLRAAKKNDMPFHLKPTHWPTNQAPASYAIIAAQSAGSGDIGALCASLLQACFAGQKDISQDDVIKGCLVNAGFDAGLTDSGLLIGAETYARNLEEAVEAGVFGSPFYIIDNDMRFFGQDRLDDLDAHLQGLSS